MSKAPATRGAVPRILATADNQSIAVEGAGVFSRGTAIRFALELAYAALTDAVTQDESTVAEIEFRLDLLRAMASGLRAPTPRTLQ